MSIRRTEKTLRNLGRVVGYKAPASGSDIEQQYKDKGYVVEKEGDKFKRIYKPAVTFDKEKKKGSSGWETLKDSYIPHEFIFDEQGRLVKELKRDTVQAFRRFEGSRTEQWKPFIEEEKIYSPSGYIKQESYYDKYYRPSSSGDTQRGKAQLTESKIYDPEGYLIKTQDVIYNKYGQRVEKIDKDYVSGEVKERGYSPVTTSYTQKGIEPIPDRQASESQTDYAKRRAAEEAARRSLISSGVGVADINKALATGTSAVKLKSTIDSIKTPEQLSKLYSGTEKLRQATLSPIQVEAAVKSGVLTKRDLSYTGEKKFTLGKQEGIVQVTGGGAGIGPKLKPLSATKELLPGKTIQMKPTAPPPKDFSTITGMGVLDSSKSVWNKIIGTKIFNKWFEKSPEDSKIKITIGEPQMPVSTAPLLPKYIDGKLVVDKEEVRIPSTGTFIVQPRMYDASDPTASTRYKLTYENGQLISMEPGKRDLLWEGEKKPLRDRWEDEKRNYIDKRIAEDEAAGIGITGSSILERPLEIEQPYGSLLKGPISVKGPEVKAIPPGLMPPSPLDLVYPQLGTTIKPVAEKIQEVRKPKAEMLEERGVMDTSVPKSEWFKTSPENLELSRRMAEANLAMLKSREDSLLGSNSKELKDIQKQREKLELEISLLYPNQDAKKILADTKGKSIGEISQTLQELGKYEGRIIPIVEKGAAEREVPHEWRVQELEARGAELEKNYALVLLENENLNIEVDKYNNWLTDKAKQEEELFSKTDVTNKQQVNAYNKFVKEYEQEAKEKAQLLEKQKSSFSSKYGNYKSAENKVLSDYEKYKKEVEEYNKEIQEKNKEREIDETLLEKANLEFKNKYYEDKTYYPTADIGGTSVQPTVVSQLKEMKGDFMPAGVFKDKPYRSEYEKDLNELNKLNEEFNQKHYPVEPIKVGDIKDIYKYVMKTGIPNADTSVAFKTKNAIESGQLKVVVKARDKLKPGEIHVDDVRQIISESGVPLRQNLERDTTFEQLKNIPTTAFQKRKTDDAAIQFLQDKITRAEEIKAGKRIATGAAYAVGTAALPGVLQAAAGLKAKSLLLKPGAKAVSWTAKALLSKPGQIAMGTLYTGSVGVRGYEGIQERDIDKLLDLGVEVGGVGTGMAWYSGTGGHPFKETFKNPWTATQVAAFDAKGQSYGRVWRPEQTGIDKFSGKALKLKTVRGISVKGPFQKAVTAKGDIPYEVVAPRQYRPFARYYDTVLGKYKYTQIEPEYVQALEQAGFKVEMRPIDTQLTFGKTAPKTPGFADFISKQTKGPIEGLEVIQPSRKVSSEIKKEFEVTPSKQTAFLEKDIIAESKGLGLVEYREVKLTSEGPYRVYTKNPRTNIWEPYDSTRFEIKGIEKEKFGYTRPLTANEEAAVSKIIKPIDTSIQTNLYGEQLKTKSSINEIKQLRDLEVVGASNKDGIIIKGKTSEGKTLYEEIPYKDPRREQVIDLLVERASQPYKSEIEQLASKIALDRVVQKTKANRLAKEQRQKEFAESRQKAKEEGKKFVEQIGQRQVTVLEKPTATEKLQQYKESYPGEQLQRAIIEADPYGMSGSRYTKYQQEPQYKKISVGPRTDFVGLKPAGQKFMELTYIAEPMEFGKVLYDQKPMYKYRQELRSGLELDQKEKLDSILIPKASTYRALDYVQKEYIQQDSGQEQRSGSGQEQEQIVIPDILEPELPPLVTDPITGPTDLIRPIKLPPFMPFIGGGGFFPQASGGYGSGRAVKSWTVTNPLKNIQQQFKLKQKIKFAQEAERRRKKALPQEAANRAFKPIRKLDAKQIKNIMGSK